MKVATKVIKLYGYKDHTSEKIEMLVPKLAIQKMQDLGFLYEVDLLGFSYHHFSEYGNGYAFFFDNHLDEITSCELFVNTVKNTFTIKPFNKKYHHIGTHTFNF